MRRATLALASALLLAGFATACGDDSSDDADEASSSSTPTDPSSSAGGPSSESPSTSDSPNTSDSPSTSESPSSDSTAPSGDTTAYCEAVSDASAAQDLETLRPAVDKIADNLPDDANADAEAGLDHLQQLLADAKDMADFTKRVTEGDDEAQAKIKEYGRFESTTCASAGEEPSAPAPSAS